MVSAPAAMNARTNTVSTTHTDLPDRACTCGRPVTSGVISSPLAIREKIASKQLRIEVVTQLRKWSKIWLMSSHHGMTLSPRRCP